MPTYEYACQSCGRRVEVFQRFADDPLTTCEECGGSLRKVFHPAGIMFKGSGFYATDSRRGSKSAGDGKPVDSKSADTAGKKKETAKNSGSAGGSGESRSGSGGKGGSDSGGSGGSGGSEGSAGSGGSGGSERSGGSGASADKRPKEKSA